ncbi:MAG TPA: hypothetical protein VG734_09300 [Lacunisphaera sp.]|nr:hypothetical protein [Lacunisphaera sp.]
MLDKTYASCVAACQACIQACESWLDLSTHANRVVEASHCTELCQSSIRLCRLVIEELKLRSAFSIQVCALGTVICRACANEFTVEPGGLDCATACRRAAEECHAIAATRLPVGAR